MRRAPQDLMKYIYNTKFAQIITNGFGTKHAHINSYSLTKYQYTHIVGR